MDDATSPEPLRICLLTSQHLLEDPFPEDDSVESDQVWEFFADAAELLAEFAQDGWTVSVEE